MLDPKINRLDYGEQLLPPVGKYDYSLDYAIGTTYSLDLEAIMVLPVALFYSRLLDCSLDELNFDVLDAITQAAEKIRVYCQKGKINVPKKYNHLMAYWEKGIEEIRMDSHASSFHPKVWIVRFTAKNKPAFYRLLITSRNLTYAHDWDIAFATEGYVGDEVIDENKPLIDFVRYLKNTGQQSLKSAFLKDLNKVKFENPDGFHLLNLYPIGINSKENKSIYTNPLQEETWDDLLVISPFVDDVSIKQLAEKSNRAINICSRKEELDCLSVETIEEIGENKFFQFSEFIRDAEYIDGMSDERQLERMLQNLHAKIFVGSKNNNQHWFMGSANCTSPAFGRNVEFMVELKTNQSKLSPKKTLKTLTESKEKDLPLFEKYDVKLRNDIFEEKNIEHDLRKIIYDVTGLLFSGKLTKREQNSGILYDLLIECDATKFTIKDGFEVQLKPLPESARISDMLIPGKLNHIRKYTGYSELQLSPFLQVSILHKNEVKKSFVLQMEIELPDTRMNKIFNSIINNEEKFLKYLSFLLSTEPPEPIGTECFQSKGDVKNDQPFQLMPIFENLLVTASRKPDRLRLIENLMKRVKADGEQGASIVSEDFLKLWSVFNEYRNRRAK